MKGPPHASIFRDHIFNCDGIPREKRLLCMALLCACMLPADGGGWFCGGHFIVTSNYINFVPLLVYMLYPDTVITVYHYISPPTILLGLTGSLA